MPEHPHVSRRTALLGLAATTLLAGCEHGDDIGEPTPSASPSSASPSSAGSSPTTPAQTPDEQLVEGVVTELNRALGVLVAAHRLKPLREVVAPLLVAHRRHVAALDGELVPTPATGAAGIKTVTRSEKRLRAGLVAAASTAESGALAKLLASMSASVTQHLDALPQEA